jgi:hypothetical protein
MNTFYQEELPLRVPRPLVCKLRGCSLRTVKRAEQAGHLVPYRLNSRVVLYTRDSVVKWLNLQPHELASGE